MKVFSSFCVGAVFILPAAATELPGFDVLRFNDDVFANEAIANDPGWYPQIKYYPLSVGEDAFVSIGGEVRQRGDYFENPDFGGAPFSQSSAWLQRYVLHADARWNSAVRTFVQVSGALEEGREGGPSPVDENGFEIQNAFLDLSLPNEGLLRLGRQELKYGSGRLVDVREGPNVRRTFTGGVLSFALADLDVDLLYAVPQHPELGNFNDDANDDESLSGIYATQAIRDGSASLEWYALRFEDQAGRHMGEVSREERYSLGTRYSGRRDEFDWNTEAIIQFGTFGSKDILAWTVANQFGYTFRRLPMRPRIGLSTNMASGDSDPLDDRLGSFNAIYPRGNYFSEAAILGPRNFFNVHPSVEFQVRDNVSLVFDTNFFWRLETGDGVYGPPGNLIRGPGGSDERFVGQSISANLAYQLSREFSVGFVYTHFLTGSFLEETGPSEDIDFFELTATWKF
ncbi:MAG: alginate export family protein [Verrucomicrobiales bacterium]|nr:alginate export family protein [Verrucomicrobiales bacterium]